MSTSRRWGSLYTAAVLFFLYIPLSLLTWSSFQGGPGIWHWYSRAFTDPELMGALGNSLIIAAATMAFSTILGTLAALALRGQKRTAGIIWLESFLGLPLILPEIVMGLSMLVWFVFLDITLGLLSVTLAHTTFCLPYVFMMVASRLKSIDPLLEEAASDLGATPLVAFFKVTLPLLVPALVSSALLAFTLSFDDFLITFFTGGVDADTLPVRIYSMMRFGVKPEMNAISTGVLLFTLLAVVVVGRLRSSSQ